MSNPANTIADMRKREFLAVSSVSRWFTPYAWFVLALNLAVILWGAFVRASGSGAGCGDHWPLCNGVVLPNFARLATIIEFTHRITSALLVIAVIGLILGAWKSFPARHRVRRAAAWAGLLTLSEGLFGAALVLLGHVENNTSPWRGVSLSLHLMNTLALIAALAAAAWFSRRTATNISVVGVSQGLQRLAITCCILFALTYAIGGIAALADTLFPATSLQQGWAQDMASGSHVFVRVRILHPFVAAAAALGIVILCSLCFRLREAASIRGLSTALICIVLAQMCVGISNLALLHPVPIQIFHLFLAAILWICLFLLCVELRDSSRHSVFH